MSSTIKETVTLEIMGYTHSRLIAAPTVILECSDVTYGMFTTHLPFAYSTEIRFAASDAQHGNEHCIHVRDVDQLEEWAKQLIVDIRKHEGEERIVEVFVRRLR